MSLVVFIDLWLRYDGSFGFSDDSGPRFIGGEDFKPKAMRVKPTIGSDDSLVWRAYVPQGEEELAKTMLLDIASKELNAIQNSFDVFAANEILKFSNALKKEEGTQ